MTITNITPREQELINRIAELEKAQERATAIEKCLTLMRFHLIRNDHMERRFAGQAIDAIDSAMQLK